MEVRDNTVAVEDALKELVRKLTNASQVQAGFINGATYPNGTPVAMVAAIQEFGAPSRGIPPRPFMRTTISDHKAEWIEGVEKSLPAFGYDAEKALTALGEQMRADLQETISSFDGDPLSPLTVMLRGMRSQAQYRDMPFGQLIAAAAARVAADKTNYGASTKQLVDTGHLIGSVDFEVT